MSHFRGRMLHVATKYIWYKFIRVCFLQHSQPSWHKGTASYNGVITSWHKVIGWHKGTHFKNKNGNQMSESIAHHMDSFSLKQGKTSGKQNFTKHNDSEMLWIIIQYTMNLLWWELPTWNVQWIELTVQSKVLSRFISILMPQFDKELS